MSFFVWCEIICIDCASTTEGCHTSSTIPRRQMKRDAIRKGWVFDTDGNAKCPRCVAGLKGSERPSTLSS